MKALGIKNMTVGEIEKILSVYPWFAFARKELLIKMSSLGDEYRNDALRRTHLYIYPEKEPFLQSYVSSLESSESSEYVEPVYELDYFDSFSIGESLSQSSDIEVNTEKEEVVAESKPKKEVYRGPVYFCAYNIAHFPQICKPKFRPSYCHNSVTVYKCPHFRNFYHIFTMHKYRPPEGFPDGFRQNCTIEKQYNT